MRWFTDAAYRWQSDGPWQRMLARYGAHVAAVADQLPPDLRTLATVPRLNLHDAEFREVVVDTVARTITLVVVPAEQFRLTLEFTDAEIVGGNLQALEQAVGAVYHTRGGRDSTVIIAQEVDVTPGRRFVLRLRLWPFHEFAIEFGSMTLQEAPMADPGPRRRGHFRAVVEKQDWESPRRAKRKRAS